MRVSIVLGTNRRSKSVIGTLQQATGEAGAAGDGGSEGQRARSRRGTTGCLSGCYGDRTPAVRHNHCLRR